MHPIYKLKEARLEESHKSWVGREVVDRHSRHLGHVKEILIEERTFEDALKEDSDVSAWTARAHFAVVNVETGLLGRLRARHVVMLPIDAMKAHGGALVADEDGDEIRTALAS